MSCVTFSRICTASTLEVGRNTAPAADARLGDADVFSP